MSHKKRDNKNRWRSLTVAFHMSPEENEDLNMRVKLSGLTKQDYLIRRCQERGIVVVPNIKVHKALKDQMAEILAQLESVQAASDISEALHDTIRMVAITVNGLNERPEDMNTIGGKDNG